MKEVRVSVVCLCQKWNDYRLRWNASDFSGVTIAHIRASSVWTPDIYLTNK